MTISSLAPSHLLQIASHHMASSSPTTTSMARCQLPYTRTMSQIIVLGRPKVLRYTQTPTNGRWWSARPFTLLYKGLGVQSKESCSNNLTTPVAITSYLPQLIPLAAWVLVFKAYLRTSQIMHDVRICFQPRWARRQPACRVLRRRVPACLQRAQACAGRALAGGIRA
eukprot:SM000182S03956  [mRNA]  locus=s182:284978:285824:- [translate_table: standard]